MNKFFVYLKEMLSDPSDNISTKRVVTLLSFILIATAFICSMAWGLTVDPKLIDAVMFIIVSGFGFTGVEKFASFAPPNGGSA